MEGYGGMEQALLLVDDEPNILSALTRLLRRDGYRILTADSGPAGLGVLAEHPEIGVILSDQRMPGMIGVEFLSQVREYYPDTVRMVLSGYTELESVTDAINRGAIYKFLTKPWEDDLLRANVAEAFRHYNMARENRRLSEALAQANSELESANRKLAHNFEVQSGVMERNLDILRLSQEILENLPFAVLGIASDDLIALANRSAREWLAPNQILLGMRAEEILSPQLVPCNHCCADEHQPGQWKAGYLADGQPVRFWCRMVGEQRHSNGCLYVLMNSH